MMNAPELYQEFARFSDPATPFTFSESGNSYIVEMVKSGQSRQYQIDKRNGQIRARHAQDRLFVSAKSLLASEEFADLRAFSDTQRRILGEKKLEDLIDPTGVVDPDGAAEKLSLHRIRSELKSLEDAKAVEVLLIDGPAGVGKTSLIERMVYERTQDPAQPPIFHITSRGRRLSNLPDAIGKTASDLDARFRTEQVPMLVRLGALQIAIDGFDELVQPDGYGNAWGALKDLIRQIGRGGPLILAGRDTFFDQQDVQAQFKKMSGGVNLRMVRLQEADTHAAMEWLRRRGWDVNELSSPSVRSFFERRYTRRPFFLSQIANLKSFSNVAVEQGSPQEILIEQMLVREADLLRKSLGDSAIDRKELRNALKTGLTTVCMEVALDMAEREADTVSHDFLEFLCEMAFSGVVDDEGVAALVQRAASTALFERSELRQESRFPHSEIQNHFFSRALMQALINARSFPALRSITFGMDIVEAFADAFLSLQVDDANRTVTELLKILATERFPPLLQSNVAAILLATLAYDRTTLPEIAIENVSIGEVRVFDKLTPAQLSNLVINRLDARGADLSNVVFASVEITSLIVDETTRFGHTLPNVSLLQIDRDGVLEANHNPIDISHWLESHSYRVELSPTILQELLRDLPIIRLYERLCRRFIRQHFIRDTDRDDGSRLLRDANWPTLKRILEKYDRLEEETKPASGTADAFYRIIRPEKLLNPSGDVVAEQIRSDVIKAALDEIDGR